MPLIAVPRDTVIHLLSEPTDAYTLRGIWPYNHFFTCEIEVIPLSEPSAVIAVVSARLNEIAEVVRFEWIERSDSPYAHMRIWITSNANPSVS